MGYVHRFFDSHEEVSGAMSLGSLAIFTKIKVLTLKAFEASPENIQFGTAITPHSIMRSGSISLRPNGEFQGGKFFLLSK